jgi:hypothetical protein
MPTLQVHWLLLALCQDHAGKNKHVEALREQCERAALDGRWVRPLPPCSVAAVAAAIPSSIAVVWPAMVLLHHIVVTVCGASGCCANDN